MLVLSTLVQMRVQSRRNSHCALNTNIFIFLILNFMSSWAAAGLLQLESYLYCSKRMSQLNVSATIYQNEKQNYDKNEEIGST